MLNWLYVAAEGCVRSSAPMLRRLLGFIPAWYVRRLSEVKLVRTLRYVYRNSPAQRKRWEKAGVRLADINSPDVLRRLPFLTGRDLAAHPENYFCVPREELTEAMSSSGTTGKPKTIYMTPDDMARQTRMTGMYFSHLPGATRAMVMVFVRNPSWTAGRVNLTALRQAGMFVIQSTSDMPIPDQINLIRKHRINLLIGGPAFLHRFVYEAEDDLKSLGVRYIIIGGQAWSEAFRREMEEAWGAKVIDGYASAEGGYGIASECACRKGLHVSEVDYWIEIVDPETGEALPDGAEGEVVFTTLSRRGMPLIRYRTGDLARLLPRGRRCRCGMPSRKMSRIRGRNDDMLILGSANVFPDEFDRAVRSAPGVTDYQLIIEKNDYRDVLNLTVEADGDMPRMRNVLIEALLTIPYVKLLHETGKILSFGRMEVVPRGTLSEDRPKSVRIIDRRGEKTGHGGC